MLAVSNATPLIYLAKADLLDMMTGSFEKVYIPREVYDEAVVKGLEKGYKDAKKIDRACDDWLIVKIVTLDIGFILKKYVEKHDLEEIASSLKSLHKGEIDAIALAIELDADRLITDDKAAINASKLISKYFKFRVIGTGNLLDSWLEEEKISEEGYDHFLKTFKRAISWIK
jgi:predicted nucleic acid-binding protein